VDGERERHSCKRESGTCELGYVQEHGVSSCGYEVKTLVECPLFSENRIGLIKVSDGLQSKNVLLVPQTLERKISRKLFH